MDKKEIRFIDSQYNELFRIPDGSEITIHYPDGHSENRTCRYIDDYHTYINDVCFHICQFAEIMERNNQTYTPTQKYKLENISQEEFLFMYDAKDDVRRGCIGYVRADFGAEKEFYTNWFSEDKSLRNDEFAYEIDNVINYFRANPSTPLLKSRADMSAVCHKLKPNTFVANKDIRGFKVKTEKHTYYFKCKPMPGGYDLYLYCYNSEELCKYLDLNFVRDNYGEICKDKFFKTDNGLREVYYNPEATAGGQLVESNFSFDDIKKVSKYHKNKEHFFSHLEALGKVYLHDVGTDEFRGMAKWFIEKKADFEGFSDDNMKAIKKYANANKSKSKKEPER